MRQGGRRYEGRRYEGRRYEGRRYEGRRYDGCMSYLTSFLLQWISSFQLTNMAWSSDSGNALLSYSGL